MAKAATKPSKPRAPDTTREGSTGSPRRRRNWQLGLFVLPGLLLYVVFLVGPTVAAFAMSLTDWNGISNEFSFVGVTNFERLLIRDPIFRGSFVNNVQFSVTVLIFQTVLSLCFALLLVRNTALNIFYRALYFFPTVIASVSVALSWILMFDPAIGALNTVLSAVGLERLTQSWLGNPGLAIYSLATVQFWQHTGQVMIIFVAGLQAVPQELYESASVEGATRWQSFRYVTWPMLASSATIVVAYTTIQTFKAFDLVIALTDGGPSFSTEILSTWIYHTAFQGFRFGYAAAGSVVFLFVLGLITVVQFRVLRVER